MLTKKRNGYLLSAPVILPIDGVIRIFKATRKDWESKYDKIWGKYKFK